VCCTVGAAATYSDDSGAAAGCDSGAAIIVCAVVRCAGCAAVVGPVLLELLVLLL
jgi:hypothetical protein